MQLIAEKREQFGKKTKALRRDRKIPAVMFGKDMESVPLTISQVDFLKIYKEAGETNLVDLSFNGSSEKVLIKEVQVHPVTSAVLHANFHKVNLKEKIQVSVPVSVVGEEENDLIRSNEALPLLILSEINIEALPTDLPDEFEVDVSNLSEIGDGITLSQLNYDKSKVELVGYEEDELVVKLDYAVQEEEEEPELTEEEMLAQVEVTGETAQEEGDDETESKEAVTESEDAEEAA